jgi:hypothetical protein
MQTIGAYAFYGCSNLQAITFTGAAPPAIATTAFTNIHNPVSLWIPAGTEANYGTITTAFPGGIIQGSDEV